MVNDVWFRWRWPRLTLLSLILLAAAMPLRAQPSLAAASAEVEIGLPAAGGADELAVVPTEGRLTLELPAGSTFPSDFESATGGFVRGSPAQPLDGGRIRLELRLLRGVLDRLEFRGNTLALKFSSREASSRHLGEGDNPYLLGPDDRISITVYDQEELDTEVTVSKLGKISVPLVGEVDAAGLSVPMLEARLADLLGEYIVSPQLSVAVEEYNSQWVMVAGEVRKPGRFALKGGTRLKEVLTEAEGFSDSAGEWITISRRREDGSGARNLVVGRLEFERGIEDPPLTHGDIVTVGRARYCYVQGEVNDPGRVELERGMTLLRAISVAGGLTDWGSQRDVRVISEGEQGPGTTHNLKRILRGKDEDPALEGGEVIYVGRRLF